MAGDWAAASPAEGRGPCLPRRELRGLFVCRGSGPRWDEAGGRTAPAGLGRVRGWGRSPRASRGSLHEPRGRAHPGPVPVESHQRGGGAGQPPPGSDTVLDPGWALKSDRWGSAHQLSPVISLSPLGFSLFKGTKGPILPICLVVLRVRGNLQAWSM